MPPQEPIQKPLKTTEHDDPNNNKPLTLTLHPVTSPASLPRSLLHFLADEFNAEVERGCTYPMEEKMSVDEFGAYWFGKFGIVGIVDRHGTGSTTSPGGLKEDMNWEEVCLGTFYVKPNYPGRCSHVCNAGFLTTPAARGRGVGQAMGEAYLHYAPRLGYKYSVFNLVFANNTPSIKLWEKLGFSTIGRVPGAGRLANSEELVDALVIGRSFADCSSASTATSTSAA